MSPSVYFGGSRSLNPSPLLAQVVAAVVASGHSVHVGCQFGADQQVVERFTISPTRHILSLVVFAVAPFVGLAPHHVSIFHHLGGHVVYSAGGQSAPIRARYLLRSIAAFSGCESAVFFSPGPGSLAVAREAVSRGLPVFAFGEKPAAVPSCAGAWVAASFVGFPCWRWQSAQLSF